VLASLAYGKFEELYEIEEDCENEEVDENEEAHEIEGGLHWAFGWDFSPLFRSRFLGLFFSRFSAFALFLICLFYGTFRLRE
jgi:hypothetical protein